MWIRNTAAEITDTQRTRKNGTDKDVKAKLNTGIQRGKMLKKHKNGLSQKRYLSVLVEMATMPSGHCSLEKPAAYSRVS